MPEISDFFDMIFSSIEFGFLIQADFWDAFGFFPTFILVFVAATFFRYIVLRMFGAAEAGASDSIVSSARADSAKASAQENYRRSIKLSERRAQINRAYRRRR